MSTGDRLDLVATDWMDTGLYYRVHPTLHPAKPCEFLSPLEANPASTARLAIRGDRALGVASRAMFYVTTSPAAALFEALFRSPQMYPGRRVVVPWHLLQGMTLSTVRLLAPEPYVPLMKPERGLVIHDAAKDIAWQWLVNTPNHADTHAAAVEVAAQFSATLGHDGAALVLPGFGYPSVQCSPDSVFLHYDPPMHAAAWAVERSVNLATEEGYRAVLVALATAGFVPVQQPAKLTNHDFDPSAGAL
jgi:hypothetical protein